MDPKSSHHLFCSQPQNLLGCSLPEVGHVFLEEGTNSAQNGKYYMYIFFLYEYTKHLGIIHQHRTGWGLPPAMYGTWQPAKLNSTLSEQLAHHNKVEPRPDYYQWQ